VVAVSRQGVGGKEEAKILYAVKVSMLVVWPGKGLLWNDIGGTLSGLLKRGGRLRKKFSFKERGVKCTGGGGKHHIDREY